MKKILFICSILFLIGCGSSDKDCNCTQQRWERKAVYTIGSDASTPPISTTEWKKTGNYESAGNDCNKNGSISKKGDVDSWPDSNGTTYTVLEFEYRVTCQ
jgi:hypothetical protein